MDEILSCTIEQDRHNAMDAFRYNAFPESRVAFERVLQRDPCDVVSLFHLGLILQGDQEPERGLALLNRAAEQDVRYALAKGMAVYLSRRLRVQESFPFEDGWLSFLDLALQSGGLPQDTMEGLCARRAAVASEPPIPRRIVQFWDKPQAPAEVSELMQRCALANSHYLHEVFCEETAQDFIATEFGTEIVDLYRNCFHASAKADFFRLAYLYRKGGFYIDADEVCDHPLDAVFQARGLRQIYSVSRGVPSCVNNWFIGTAANAPIVERAFELCVGNLDAVLRQGPRSNVWVLTGPGVLSFAILDLFCEPPIFGDGRVFDDAMFIDETEYRQMFEAPPMAYKSHKEGNWRMA